MNYNGTGSGGAAVQYSSGGVGRVVNIGFPFETITVAAVRNSVMSAVLNFFGLGLAGISGFVFRDVNGNNIKDAGEIGFSGRSVFFDDNSNNILDAGETNTTTDANGFYQFLNF